MPSVGGLPPVRSRGHRRDLGGEEIGDVEEDMLATTVGESLDTERMGRAAAGGDGQAGKSHERRRDLGHLRTRPLRRRHCGDVVS